MTNEEYVEGNFEFWFNWGYAQANKPHLMSIGRGGSFNEYRKLFLIFCKGGDRERAEETFWEMIRERDEDTARQYPVDVPRTEEELRQLWLTPALEMDPELYYFIRKVKVKKDGSWLYRYVRKIFLRAP